MWTPTTDVLLRELLHHLMLPLPLTKTQYRPKATLVVHGAGNVLIYHLAHSNVIEPG